MATAMGVGSSNGSSSESEVSAVEAIPDRSNSPIRSPDTTTNDVLGPYLELVEPPVESCRFRYPTEMKGTHGSIMGISTLKKDNAKKKIYPSVKLHNYHLSTQNKKVIIRCSLTTADEDINSRFPHVHQLKGKGITSTSQFKTVEIDDPIDIEVSGPNYLAVFSNMTILYIKKDGQISELVKKKKRHIRKMYPYKKLVFSEADEREFLEEATKEVASMDTSRLNTACLKFEALEIDHGQLQFRPICPEVYSKPIKNIKSAQFNELRICRIDKVAGSCLGREEVFIFVEKVNKKDIKVRFFEVNEEKEEIWEAYGDFTEDDVHFQFAIAFKTPRYKNVEITDNVQVYFQLERPSNDTRSEPMGFEYYPDPNRWRDEVRKRPRRASPPIPETVQDFSRPSTSISTTSSWNPPRVNNVFNLNEGLLTSSSPSDSSEFAMISEDSLSELLGFFGQDLPNDILGDQQMEIEPEESSSINSLCDFPSGDSDVISQLLKNPEYAEALSKYAKCNGVSLSDRQIEEIKSDAQFVMDGAVRQPRIAIAQFQSGGPCYIGPQLDPRNYKRVVIQAPVAQMDPGDDDQGFYQGHPEMMDVVRPQMDLGHIDRVFHQGPVNEDRQRSQLTKVNIASKILTIVNVFENLKKHKKVQEKFLKRCLLGIFSTCVGENEDRVLHILASNPIFPPLILTFLNVLKMYNIAESVINLKNKRGETALHLAAEKGSLQTISLLVECGADVNARDLRLNTPLHLVANREQTDAFHAVGHILEKNPDLNIYNIDGVTALHLFVTKRKSDIISSLIVKSEDRGLKMDLINQPDRKQGNTALHMAVQNKFLEIVNLLLNFEDRIDVNAKNFDDKTPLAYASGDTEDDFKIEELLIANKADPALVLTRKNKTLKEVDELKHEVDNSLDEAEESEDCDESSGAYAQDWKSDGELKLMDKKAICSVCSVLDENKNWTKLLKKLDFDEDILHFLEVKWSPTLYLLKIVVETSPNITSEKLRDILIKINNPECKKAAQFIDDMILRSMGVF